MTDLTLQEIIEQGLQSDGILACLACHLMDDDSVVQSHRDDLHLKVYWRQRQNHWRRTIFPDVAMDICFAQIDIHDDGTVRVESSEPCSIQVSREDDVLCVTRILV